MTSSTQAQTNSADVKALRAVYAVNVMGEFVRDWCIARAPQAKAAVSSGFAAWRQDTKLDVLEQKLNAVSNADARSARETLEGNRQKIYTALDKSLKNPVQECASIQTYLNQNLHPQKFAPNEYAAALKIQVSQTKPVQPPTNGKAAASNATVPKTAASSNKAATGTTFQDGKLGGPLKIGTYACFPVRGGVKKESFDLSLYDNKEWRISRNGKEVTTSTYNYNPANGRISISSTWNMSNSDYYEDVFSYFMTLSKNNQAVVYAEDDYGLGVYKTTCIYAGANKLAAPSVVKEQKAAAEAEERRFKWVTAPGKGVPMNQIQAIVRHGEGVTRYDGYTFEESWVLLLKDGWAYTGLRVSPHDLDVKKSRQNEPEKWVKWKQQGGNYLTLNPQTNIWNKLPGTPGYPAKAGEQLNKTFTYYSSSTSIFGGYASQNHISFNTSGSFEESGSSISGTGPMQSINNFSSTTTSSYGKDGCTAASSAISGGATNSPGTTVVTGSNKNRDCGADNAGKYTLNGYTLERRYANGKVTRDLFFFPYQDKTAVFIGGGSYSSK